MATGKFYVTTPIYYVNDRPHIGHVYTTTIADVVARYRRLKGEDVFFLTGVDEHAAKVVDKAKEMGLSTQAWADRNAQAFRDTFAKLGMTNNDFVRTTEDRHKTKVQEYVSALLKSGDVYLGDYEGWYDAGQEEYVTEANAEAAQFKSVISGRPLIRKKEKNYFFRLSAYRQALQEHFAKNPHFVQPDARRNEILNRIADMVDVPVSRSGTGGWGIPMPGDDTQSIYVWIDALFNYISYMDTPERRPYWQSGAVHLIAKDILWFHAAIWPALLISLAKCPGYEWVTLPKQVYSHSFWISEGQKMSKMLGNFIDLEKIDEYVARFGLDALRYFLASNGPLGTNDSDFAEAKFIEVYNADLANKLGNCFSRISNMTKSYFDGKLPASPGGVLEPAAKQAVEQYITAMDKTDLASGFGAAIGLVRAVDEYIEKTAPFKMVKDPAKKADVGAILADCVEALRIASVLLSPVLTVKTAELWKRLGLEEYSAALAAGKGDLAAWTTWGVSNAGSPVGSGDALYPRWSPPKA